MEYVVNSGRQKYCSDECQREAVLEWQRDHKQRYNIESGQYDKKIEKRKNSLKICVYCGKQFHSDVATNLCSDYCRRKQKQIHMRVSDAKRGVKSNIEQLMQERNDYRKSIAEN